MSWISRRTLLAGSAVFGTTLTGTAIAREQEPSRELSALIEAHKAAYVAFMKAIRKPQGARNDHSASSLVQEKALLAVCGFPAVGLADRRAKATHLLQIEAAASSTSGSTCRRSSSR